MKRPGKAVANGAIIALALTWDGARWPLRKLPPQARAFLARANAAPAIPSARKMAELFENDSVSQLRICWVPRLLGGDDVLSVPFSVPAGLRMAFTASKPILFGDILGVVYLRA
jgi:hypothetical protein